MSDGTNASVLVVDDEPQIRDLYCRYLEDDYRVSGAASASEALASVGPETDVVLLDRLMPERSGREVLAEIRGRGLDCRVAMVTAVRPDVDIIDLGFDDYVVKPVSRAELRNLVDSLLRWSDYDDVVSAYYQAVRKVEVLEAELTPSALAESEEYERLQAEVDALRERAQDATADPLPGELDLPAPTGSPSAREGPDSESGPGRNGPTGR